MEAKLVIIAPENSRGEYKLKLPTVIGRGREANLKLVHPLISRRHCELYETNGQLRVRDLGSMNGTFISSERVTDALLPAGELLTVGTVTFQAVYSSPSAKAAAAMAPAARLADTLPPDETIEPLAAAKQATTAAAAARTQNEGTETSWMNESADLGLPPAAAAQQDISELKLDEAPPAADSAQSAEKTADAPTNASDDPLFSFLDQPVIEGAAEGASSHANEAAGLSFSFLNEPAAPPKSAAPPPASSAPAPSQAPTAPPAKPATTQAPAVPPAAASPPKAAAKEEQASWSHMPPPLEQAEEAPLQLHKLEETPLVPHEQIAPDAAPSTAAASTPEPDVRWSFPVGPAEPAADDDEKEADASDDNPFDFLRGDK